MNSGRPLDWRQQMSALPPMGTKRLVRPKVINLPAIGTYARGQMEYEADKVGIVVAHHERVEDVCGLGESFGPCEPQTGPGVTIRTIIDHEHTIGDFLTPRERHGEELVFAAGSLVPLSDFDRKCLANTEADEDE